MQISIYVKNKSDFFPKQIEENENKITVSNEIKAMKEQSPQKQI